MDIILNRRGGVSVREQIVNQLELKILEGALAQGQRLPSVRALARRLEVHHNTVSAAYQDLEASGHVELQRGAGVFVRRAGAGSLQEASGLDEMIRLALHTAFRKGFTGAQVRTAVERWLKAAPPDRVVVVDPSPEMAELVAAEIAGVVGVPAGACSLDALAADPRSISGALVLVLAYHVDAVRRIAPEAAIAVVTLEVSRADRQVIEAVPEGSIVLVVSHAPTLLPFASVFLRSLRGDDVLVEALPLSAPREWMRLVPAADLVVADVLSLEAVRRAKPRRLHEVHVVPASAIERLRTALTAVVPARAGGPPDGAGGPAAPRARAARKRGAAPAPKRRAPSPRARR